LTLRDCIAIAIERNFDIRLNRLEFNNSLQDAEIARAAFDPALTSTVSTERSQAAVANSELQGAPQPKSSIVTASFGLTTHLPTGADFSLNTGSVRNEDNSSFSLLNPSYSSDFQVNLRQPLLRNGGLHVTGIPLALSKIAILDADFRLRKGILSTISAVEMAYWDASVARQEESFAKQDFETAETLLEEVKVRAEAGLSNGLDRLRAETAVANKREALITTRQATANRVDALLLLLGMKNFDEVLIARTTTLPIFGGVVPDPREEIARAEETDPDYLITLDGARRSKLTVDQARNGLLPSVDLVAAGTASGRSSTFSSAYDRAANRDGTDWSIGVEVRIPLTFREERARLQQAKNGQSTAEIQVEQAAQKLMATVRTACRAMESSEERAKAAGAALQLSEHQYEFAKEQFEQGLVELRDVLEAQQALASERVNHLRARVEVIRAEVELRRLDGTLLAEHGLAWKENRKPMIKR